MKHRNTIDHDLLSELEDHYNGYGNFEKIPKGEKNSRQDSKRISDKGERKIEKEKRRKAQEGKWEGYFDTDQQFEEFAW